MAAGSARSVAHPATAVALEEPPAVVNLAANRTFLATLRPQITPAASAAIMARLGSTPKFAVTGTVRTVPGTRSGPLAPPSRPVVAPPPPPPKPVIVPPPPPTPKPVAATNLGTTFRYTRVTIQRPWIDHTLFHLPGWSLGGIDKGSISTGQADNNPGMMPLLPLSFIAVKDVVINGSWSDSDKQSANAAVAGNAVASFGPMTISGGGAEASSFDGSSLKVPGIQIIAWICQVLPVLPPT